ncbi:MAG TPA: restriction endonuclease subunit S [Ruminococcus sp.]|nr:restriction endonuclease subunit S [Ruminococcus sp.]HBA02095.1 restriction endonuclease subunit S [Ruminococcus sp.]
MIELKNAQWGQIRLADIFDEIPRGKVSDLKNVADGKTIIIAASGVNEGFSRFSNDEPISKNAMTISFNGVGTGTAFVHNYLFNLNSDCGLVKPKENISLYALRFIAVSINQNKNKFNYGYKANESRILRQTVLLPISDDGQPDYDFMEAYIKKKEKIKREEYLDYCQQQLKVIGGGYDLIPLKDKEWKSFFIVDVFDTIQRGKRLKTADHLAGEIPYVSSSALNNGVDDYVSNNNGVRRFSNCLSLANSGSVGSSFYEPFEFVASDHITHLKNEEFNKYHYLFLATVTSRLSQKYNFNREINDKRISREIILLPLNDKGEPDYEYMEKYSKNLLCEKIQMYIKYIENK